MPIAENAPYVKYGAELERARNAGPETATFRAPAEGQPASRRALTGEDAPQS